MRLKIINKILGHIFKRKIPKTYEPRIEKFTECDLCQYRSECKADGKLFEITSLEDIRRHLGKLPGTNCRKAE